MPTNWVTPSADDLAKVIALAVLSKAEQNTDPDSIAAALKDPDAVKSFDPDLDDRASDKINLAVALFRGAIQIAGKSPLSITTGTVPPEVYQYVLDYAAFGFVTATPNLQSIIMNDKGAASALQKLYEAAVEYLEKLRTGLNIVQPNDPTGKDYLTALQPNPTLPNFNPAICGTRVGGMTPQTDLTTYGGVWQEYEQFFPTCELGQP